MALSFVSSPLPSKSSNTQSQSSQSSQVGPPKPATASGFVGPPAPSTPSGFVGPPTREQVSNASKSSGFYTQSQTTQDTSSGGNRNQPQQPTTYNQQVNDYLSKKAGTYGNVSVPTSTLINAANSRNSDAAIYNYVSSGRGNYGYSSQQGIIRTFTNKGYSSDVGNTAFQNNIDAIKARNDRTIQILNNASQQQQSYPPNAVDTSINGGFIYANQNAYKSPPNSGGNYDEGQNSGNNNLGIIGSANRASYSRLLGTGTSGNNSRTNNVGGSSNLRIQFNKPTENVVSRALGSFIQVPVEQVKSLSSGFLTLSKSTLTEKPLVGFGGLIGIGNQGISTTAILKNIKNPDVQNFEATTILAPLIGATPRLIQAGIGTALASPSLFSFASNPTPESAGKAAAFSVLGIAPFIGSKSTPESSLFEPIKISKVQSGEFGADYQRIYGENSFGIKAGVNQQIGYGTGKSGTPYAITFNKGTELSPSFTADQTTVGAIKTTGQPQFISRLQEPFISKLIPENQRPTFTFKGVFKTTAEDTSAQGFLRGRQIVQTPNKATGYSSIIGQIRSQQLTENPLFPGLTKTGTSIETLSGRTALSKGRSITAQDIINIGGKRQGTSLFINQEILRISGENQQTSKFIQIGETGFSKLGTTSFKETAINQNTNNNGNVLQTIFGEQTQKAVEQSVFSQGAKNTGQQITKSLFTPTKQSNSMPVLTGISIFNQKQAERLYSFSPQSQAPLMSVGSYRNQNTKPSQVFNILNLQTPKQSTESRALFGLKSQQKTNQNTIGKQIPSLAAGTRTIQTVQPAQAFFFRNMNPAPSGKSEAPINYGLPSLNFGAQLFDQQRKPQFFGARFGKYVPNIRGLEAPTLFSSQSFKQLNARRYTGAEVRLLPSNLKGLGVFA